MANVQASEASVASAFGSEPSLCGDPSYARLGLAAATATTATAETAALTITTAQQQAGLAPRAATSTQSHIRPAVITVERGTRSNKSYGRAVEDIVGH